MNPMFDFTQNEISAMLLAIRIFGVSLETENTSSTNLPDDFLETLMNAHQKLVEVSELRDELDNSFNSIAQQLPDLEQYGNQIINAQLNETENN